jgi:hypothetical protein
MAIKEVRLRKLLGLPAGLIERHVAPPSRRGSRPKVGKSRLVRSARKR